MDIQGTQPDSGPRKAFEDRRRALSEANRAFIRAAQEDLYTVSKQRVDAAKVEEKRAPAEASKGARRDALELSAAARAASEATPAEREARIRELTEAHRMARLHTPERLERAAQRLLEG